MVCTNSVRGFSTSSGSLGDGSKVTHSHLIAYAQAVSVSGAAPASAIEREAGTFRATSAILKTDGWTRRLYSCVNFLGLANAEFGMAWGI